MTHNPQISGPTAGRSQFVWLFFGFKGRIGREVYWLAIGLLWAILFVAIGILIEMMGREAAGGPVLVLGVASLWSEVAILVKRQHDRGLPWFWCLLAFIPLAGALWMIACGILKGDDGPNAYGPAPDIPPT